MKKTYCIVLLYCFFFCGNAFSEKTLPTLNLGAKVYQERCVLCHGSQAMGEGALALAIKDYPNTNLLVSPKFKSKEAIHKVIVSGAMLPNVSQYMPPMGNELTWTELESVALFVQYFRSETPDALAMLESASSDVQTVDVELGRAIFNARCTLCHGDTGKGDGRMSKVITSPPPFNLTLSAIPKSYVIKIISQGGAALGRSPQMPPWGEQLGKKEVESVANYLFTLRTL